MALLEHVLCEQRALPAPQQLSRRGRCSYHTMVIHPYFASPGLPLPGAKRKANVTYTPRPLLLPITHNCFQTSRSSLYNIPTHSTTTLSRGIIENYSCCIFQGPFQLLILQILPTSERAVPTFQPNMPAHQQGDDATTQNRSCPRCSEAQRTQVRPTTEYPVGQQDPRPVDVSSLDDDSTI